MAKMMRISDAADTYLENLKKVTGKSKIKLLERALADLERNVFLKKTSEQYAELKKDKKAWKEMLEETAEWDITLLDGLENE